MPGRVISRTSAVLVIIQAVSVALMVSCLATKGLAGAGAGAGAPAEWAQAKALAATFWRAVAVDTLVSSGFRAIALENLGHIGL